MALYFHRIEGLYMNKRVFLLVVGLAHFCQSCGSPPPRYSRNIYDMNNSSRLLFSEVLEELSKRHSRFKDYVVDWDISFPYLVRDVSFSDEPLEEQVLHVAQNFGVSYFYTNGVWSFRKTIPTHSDAEWSAANWHQDPTRLFEPCPMNDPETKYLFSLEQCLDLINWQLQADLIFENKSTIKQFFVQNYQIGSNGTSHVLLSLSDFCIGSKSPDSFICMISNCFPNSTIGCRTESQWSISQRSANHENER